MDPSNDGQSSTSDYLEPRSVSVPIPAPPEDGWHGRLSSFWDNIVSTLRLSGRSKRKRQVLERTQDGQTQVTASSAWCRAERSSAKQYTWKYVGTFGRMNVKKHSYYNLIEEFSFHGPCDNAVTSNDHSTFWTLRTPKKKRFGLFSVTGRKINCEQKIHRAYLLDNYIYLQVLIVLSCKILIHNFVSNTVVRRNTYPVGKWYSLQAKFGSPQFL